MPCSSSVSPRSGAPRRITLLLRYSGRALCWSLAAGMTSAALDLALDPQDRRWHATWALPWYLTCACALVWAALRAREKGTQTPPDEDGLRDNWDRAA